MSETRQHLKGRVAIVTGAGKGLGRAWATHLAKRGARVVVNNRPSGKPAGTRSADIVVAEIEAAGGEAVANYQSVETADAGQNLVDTALKHYGALDIIIANAGIDRAGSFHRQELDDFETVIEVNFLSVARMLHAAWPVLRNSNYGRVLVASSTAGLYGNHGQAAYASSKAALQGLVKTLAIEGRSRNILVNSLAPYAVTQMTRSAFPQQQMEIFSPQGTAELVGWLVSEACKLSGRTIIAGAKHARLVQTLESDTISLGANLEEAIAQLIATSCQLAPTSATDEFENFTASL